MFTGSPRSFCAFTATRYVKRMSCFEPLSDSQKAAQKGNRQWKKIQFMPTRERLPSASIIAWRQRRPQPSLREVFHAYDPHRDSRRERDRHHDDRRKPQGRLIREPPHEVSTTSRTMQDRTVLQQNRPRPCSLGTLDVPEKEAQASRWQEARETPPRPHRPSRRKGGVTWRFTSGKHDAVSRPHDHYIRIDERRKLVRVSRQHRRAEKNC